MAEEIGHVLALHALRGNFGWRILRKGIIGRRPVGAAEGGHGQSPEYRNRNYFHWTFFAPRIRLKTAYLCEGRPGRAIGILENQLCLVNVDRLRSRESAVLFSRRFAHG